MLSPTPPALDAPLQEGSYVGPYVVEATLGAGMFGTVYAGRHPVIETQVAIKVLHPQYSSNPNMVARFIDEARAAGHIDHPSIVRVFDFGRLPDGRPYSIMERLRGEALDDRLDGGVALSPDEALPILAAIASALEAAHRAGVAHRDVKPANIFLCAEGPAKLLDFGVAKLLDMASDAQRTKTGVAIGTPAYMAPEQCLGRDVGPAADVYALGVLAFRMLAGRLPYESASSVGMMAAHLNDPAPRVHRIRPGLSPALSRVIQRMMAKDAARRPAPVEAIRLLEAAAHATAPRALIAGAVALALLGGVGAFVVFGGAGPSPEAPPDATPMAPASVTPPPDARPPVDAGPRDALPPAVDAGSVALRLEGLPDGAVVRLDGVMLALDGETIRLPRGSGVVALEVSAPGYIARDLEVRPTADGAIDATLQRPKRARPPKRGDPDDVDDW